MGNGPFTPNRTPGEEIEEGILFKDRGSAGDNAGPPTSAGEMRYVDGEFALRDAAGLVNPREGHRIQRTMAAVVVPAGTTLLQHEPEIPDGVEVEIADGGELLVL